MLNAQLWFDTALSYAPSPFMPKIRTSRTVQLESLCDFSEAETLQKAPEQSSSSSSSSNAIKESDLDIEKTEQRWTISANNTWIFCMISTVKLGSLLSAYGCYHYHNKVRGDRSEELDAERGSDKRLGPNNEERHDRQIAGFWGYAFQIIFQMNAGAVVLTDCVFWFIIVPFLAIKDYNLNFLIINMHTVNAVFLIGDTALNCLVLISGIVAYTMLWNFRIGNEVETLSAVEMVSRDLSESAVACTY